MNVKINVLVENDQVQVMIYLSVGAASSLRSGSMSSVVILLSWLWQKGNGKDFDLPYWWCELL